MENLEPYKLNKNYTVTATGDVIIVRTGNKMKPYKMKNGYLTVKLWDGKKYHSRYVHRLVATKFCSRECSNTEVNHKDGNKQNNNVDNLEWVTKSVNMKHAYRMGLNKPSPQPGSKHGNSKLIEQDILDILDLRQKGISLAKIAELYPVTKATIWKISKNLSWRHINV